MNYDPQNKGDYEPSPFTTYQPQRPMGAPDNSYQPPVGAPDNSYQPPIGAPGNGYQPPVGAPGNGYQPPVGAPGTGYQPPVGAPGSGYQPPVGAPGSGYQPPHAAPAPAKVTVPGKGLGIAALILSVLSILLGFLASCGCYCFTYGMFGMVGSIPFMITAIVAIILGAVGLKKAKAADMKNPLALTGLILGIVALILMIAVTAFSVIVLSLGFTAGFLESLG